MIIDLKCPIELRGYRIVYDDAGLSIATIDLFNLSDFTISAYSAVFHCEYTQAGTSSDTVLSVDNLAIEGGVEFKLELPVELINADKLEMYFSKVEFSDHETWTGSESNDLVDIGELKPLKGDELDHLRDIAGDDAVLYPEMQDKFWRCVCGRINTLDEDECYRCRRQRDFVLTELNSKILNLNEQEAKERKRRLKLAKKAREKELYKDSGIAYSILLLTSVVLFILLFVYFGFIFPGIGA